MRPLELRAARQLLSFSHADLVGRAKSSFAIRRWLEAGKSIGHRHADALRQMVDDTGVMTMPMGTDVGDRAVAVDVGSIRRSGGPTPSPAG